MSMADMALLALLALARAARKKINRAVKDGYSTTGILSAILADMRPVEGLISRTFRDGQILAWLQGGIHLLKALPEPLPVQNAGTSEQVPTFRITPPAPPEPVFPDRTGDPEPVVRFPAIEKAANYLRNRIPYTPDEFRELDDDAREVGFTVAKAIGLDAVEKIQQALSRHVAEGGTLRQFREEIAEVVDRSDLSESQVENVYRTQIALAYASGKWSVRDHPLIADAFMYVLRSCVHDARTRDDHLAFEHLGMTMADGSRGPIYRADDPVIRRYAAPWSYRCRCSDIFISTKDAARYGVREAIEWERSGQPPFMPEYVSDPGFPIPSGWPPVGRLRPAF